MAFTAYSSADASAPTLDGTVGSLIDVLDACLVDGYGAKTAAGWAKSFSGTNKAAYRPPAGTRFYLRVQDDGPGAGGAREARVTGYETMSDVDTGGGLFGGEISSAFVVWRKSNTADSTARAWLVYADGRTVYIFIATGDSSGVYMSYAFGDFYSIASGDAYNCLIIGRETENSVSNTLEGMASGSSIVGTDLAGHYAARTSGGGGGEVTLGKHGDIAKSTFGSSSRASWNGLVTAPNGPDGAYYLAPCVIVEGSNIRGRMRGWWQLCNVPTGFTLGDTFSGANGLLGKTFQVVKNIRGAGGNPDGAGCIETSDTLETNS